MQVKCNEHVYSKQKAEARLFQDSVSYIWPPLEMDGKQIMHIHSNQFLGELKKT